MLTLLVRFSLIEPAPLEDRRCGGCECGCGLGKRVARERGGNSVALSVHHAPSPTHLNMPFFLSIPRVFGFMCFFRWLCLARALRRASLASARRRFRRDCHLSSFFFRATNMWSVGEDAW